MYKIRGKIKKTETININTQKGDFVKKLITIVEGSYVEESNEPPF